MLGIDISSSRRMVHSLLVSDWPLTTYVLAPTDAWTARIIKNSSKDSGGAHKGGENAASFFFSRRTNVDPSKANL